MSEPSLKSMLELLAEQGRVGQYRVRDISRNALKAKYKNSSFACPEIRFVRDRRGNLLEEAIQTSFDRISCNGYQTLTQLRTQRDKFLRCALLRDWARQRGYTSNVKHLPPLYAAWEHAQQCQECILNKALTEGALLQESKLLKYITTARHEASSNNSEGRNFPRLTVRSNKRNATRRSTAAREHH